MKSFVVLAVLAVFAVNSAYGLKCYDCTNCEDLKDDFKATECEADVLVNIPADLPTTPAPGTTPTTPKAPDTTPTTPQAPVTPGQTGRFNRNVRADEFKCVKASVVYGEGEVIIRGCTKKECKTGTLIKSCDTCDGDSCNFAPGVKSWALSSIVLVAVIKMFL